MKVVERNTLSEMLRAIRREQGWTQEELARRFGVTSTQVRNIETGRSDMPATRLLQLLEDVGWLTDKPPYQSRTGLTGGCQAGSEACQRFRETPASSPVLRVPASPVRSAPPRPTPDNARSTGSISPGSPEHE